MGAWGFNSVLNGAILLLFLRFYVKMYLTRKKSTLEVAREDDAPSMKLKDKDT